MSINNILNNNKIVGKSGKSKCPKKASKSDWKPSVDLNVQPSAPTLRPIQLNWFETTLYNSLADQYQFNWSNEDYEIVELYKPLSSAGFDFWIKCGSNFMIEQIKVASTFAEMKDDKIRPADLKLAQGVIFDGVQALVPDARIKQ